MNYIKNLTSWLNKQQISQIKFMYFNASDLTKAKVRTAFKKFNVNNDEFYIAQGITINFFYIYSESVIKYLMNLQPTSEANIYDASFVGLGGDVNHGDHIDLSIIQMKNNDILIKTHKTMYIDLGGFVFTRTAPQCNFIATAPNLQNVENIYCELPNGKLQGNQMKNIYDLKELNCIQFLCDKMTQITPGGRIKQSGGRFLESEKLLYDLFIKKLVEYRPDVDEIRIFHQDHTKHIIILIDFVEDRRSIMLLEWPIKNNIDKAILQLGPKETFI